MKAKIALALAVVLMVLFFGIKLFLPYPMPKTNKILPSELPNQEYMEESQLVEKMLVNNLWDKDRGMLDPNYSIDDNEVSTDLLGSPDENDNAPWQLVGVSFDGERRFALIQVGSEVKSLKQDELLPNGAKVAEVLSYGIQTTRSGKNEKFYLFGKK
ncbi:MAG: hypothetical protein K9K86_00480 [Pseudomonadales bacterium]|nr:hypothetical protein [Pseudomonadales bacterium]